MRVEVEHIVLYDIVTVDLDSPPENHHLHGKLANGSSSSTTNSSENNSSDNGNGAGSNAAAAATYAFVEADLAELEHENSRLFAIATGKCQALKNAWEEKLWSFTHEEQLARLRVGGDGAGVKSPDSQVVCVCCAGACFGPSSLRACCALLCALHACVQHNR